MTEIINTIERKEGARVSYRVFSQGSGNKAIVLCHGLASNMTRWFEFAEFTSLKNSWDIILPDLRGHGSSLYRGVITMEEWCGDIAAILDREGYEFAAVGGHCLGANIAINFAALYPEKCRGIVLLEPLFSESFTGVFKRLGRHRIILNLFISLSRIINCTGIYRRKIPSLDLRELDRAGRELIEKSGSPEVLRKRYGSPLYDLRYIPVAAYLQSVRELLRPLPDLKKIAVPKLFIFSSGRIFSESCDLNELCGSLTDCETVIIDSYHWVPTEKPVELREAIEQWCFKHFD